MQDAWDRDSVRSARAVRSIGEFPPVGMASVENSTITGSRSKGWLVIDQETIAGDVGQTRNPGQLPDPLYARPANILPMDEEYERVIVEHLPIVRFLARRIHERLPHQVDIEDLVSSGVLGLLDALQKFDPGKKVQFRSYAQFRIRGAILDSLRTLDWSPRDLRRKGRSVEEAIRNLTARVGRAPSEAEIAAEMAL